MYSLIFSQRNHELDKDFRYVCKQQNTVAVMTSHMTARGLFWEIMMTSIRSLARSHRSRSSHKALGTYHPYHHTRASWPLYSNPNICNQQQCKRTLIRRRRTRSIRSLVRRIPQLSPQATPTPTDSTARSTQATRDPRLPQYPRSTLCT